MTSKQSVKLSGYGEGGTTISGFDGTSVDAFGRLRVSDTTVQFASFFLNDARAEIMTKKETTGGTVTHNSTRKEMEMAVTTSSGSRAVYQSREYIRYTPGQSSVCEISGRFDSGTANCIQRFGQFDDDNGLFFELNGTTMYTVIRSKISGSVVDTKVAQSNWSFDKMNGVGPTGDTLDITKHQIFFIDYQWLGAGRVRFGFNTGGVTSIVDERLHANVSTSMYMQTASLPVRCEIINTGAIESAKTLRLSCCTVYNEGNISTSVLRRATSLSTTPKSIGNTAYVPVISIRLQSAYNRGLAIPEAYDLLNITANDSYNWAVIVGATLTGASWAAVSGSIVERDIAATALTGGTIIDQGYLTARSTGKFDLFDNSIRLVSDFDGTADIFTLAARVFSGTGSIYGSVSWIEYK